jgi:hypothetical protein
MYGLFSQVYPILLATIASIGRSKLSLFAAHFSVAISASPVSVYISYQALYNARYHPAIFCRVLEDTKKSVALWLALILPFLWLTLNLVSSFSSTAFNSNLCKGTTLSDWFDAQISINFVVVLRDILLDTKDKGGLETISITALWLWGICFVRPSSST